MKTNFTPQQIKWASQHDWFFFGNSSAVYCWNRFSDGSCTAEKITSFQQLRDWAGY